jgi:hypothetical protein
MKKLLLVLFSAVLLLSCSAEESYETTALEGRWRLLNNPSLTIITFEGQNWKVDSHTVEITGTFTISGDTFTATALERNGSGSNTYPLETFSGKALLDGDEVTFSEFSGNWEAIFSNWYKKQ